MAGLAGDTRGVAVPSGPPGAPSLRVLLPAARGRSRNRAPLTSRGAAVTSATAPMAGERRRRGGDGPRERPRERLRERDPKLRQQQKPPRGSGRSRTALALLAAAAALALGLAAAAAEWKRWSEASRLVTPHPAAPAVPPGSTGPLASPSYFWGTYRPHLYFGMRTRSPRSVVTGEGRGGGSARPGARPAPLPLPLPPREPALTPARPSRTDVAPARRQPAAHERAERRRVPVRVADARRGEFRSAGDPR